MQEVVDEVKMFLLVVSESVDMQILLFVAYKCMICVLLDNFRKVVDLPLDVRLVWILNQ